MALMRVVVYFGVGLALLALGYYTGREVGRLEPVREELRRARDRKSDRDG